MSSGNTAVSKVDEENIVPIILQYSQLPPLLALQILQVITSPLHELKLLVTSLMQTNMNKSLLSDEKLDAIQSEVSTPFPYDCNQPGEILVTTPLSSETDCSHLINSSYLNAHLPIPSNIRLLSKDTMNAQNIGLPQSTFELKEIDSTVECESLEHHLISIPKPHQVPDIDTSVIATSTSKLLSKILQEVSIRCKKRTTHLPTIQINSSHSKTLGLSNIQKKDFKKKRKKDFKMFDLSQEQAHTNSLGQNARLGVVAPTYNVNNVMDLHNQRILMILTGIGHLQVNCISIGCVSVVVLTATQLT